MGVDRIAPFTSERSVPKPRPEKAVHWRKIAESAAAQSGRVKVPVIDEPVKFDKAIKTEAELKIMLWEGEKQQGLDHILGEIGGHETSSCPPISCSLFVGPEGGFTNPEVAAAKENKVPFKLTPLPDGSHVTGVFGILNAYLLWIGCGRGIAAVCDVEKGKITAVKNFEPWGQPAINKDAPEEKDPEE